jgi:8-amino-7-oxononanoate synthase
MTSFETELRERLVLLQEQGLYRRLRQVDSPPSPRCVIEGKSLLSFSSNDYLGLASHPALKEAAIHAIERYGAGAASSRLICGSLTPHHRLDEVLAAFKQTPAALAFSTGYAAAVGTICSIIRPDDILIIDKLVHASIVDAARLCGATLRIFRHNDLNHLEHLLKWAGTRRTSEPIKRSNTLIVTETVFSMDGDRAPLREIVQLKEKYGAWLMVDEAHSTGIYGPGRRGLAEELEVSERIEIQMGTLGKAAGASGGYICGSRSLIDYLVNRARSFIFSTAPVPAAAAAATEGIRLIQSGIGEERRTKLWQLVSALPLGLSREKGAYSSPILSILVGDENMAIRAASTLLSHGIFIPAIRYPSVARGHARLRLTVTAGHTEADLAELGKAAENLKLGICSH